MHYVTDRDQPVINARALTQRSFMAETIRDTYSPHADLIAHNVKLSSGTAPS